MSKSRRLIYLWQNMIISFWVNFLLLFSRVMKHIKTTKFNEKRKLCQNHEGSCYYYHTFWNPKKLPLSSIEKKHKNMSLLESDIGGLREKLSNFEKLWRKCFFVHEDFFQGEAGFKELFHSHSKGLYNDPNGCMNHPKWLFGSCETCSRHIRNYSTAENYFFRLDFRKLSLENE